MSEEAKKSNQTEQEPEQEVKPADLSEQELDKVSGASYQPPKSGQIDKGGKSW
jgi:hypothetical protein